MKIETLKTISLFLIAIFLVASFYFLSVSTSVKPNNSLFAAASRTNSFSNYISDRTSIHPASDLAYPRQDTRSASVDSTPRRTAESHPINYPSRYPSPYARFPVATPAFSVYVPPTQSSTRPNTNPASGRVYTPPASVQTPAPTSVANPTTPVVPAVPPAATPNPAPNTPVTTPLIPGKGRHFTDPDFGTSITQITDQEDGKDCTNAYSYWQSMNANDTKLFILCDSTAWLYDFDPQNLSVSSKSLLFTNLPAGVSLNWEDALWSDIDPNILYAHSGSAIWSYNTSSHSALVLKDLAAELGNKSISQMSKSLDDNRFAFTIKDPARGYAVAGYAVWDRAQNKIIYQKNTSVLDEVQIDKSGGYLVAKTGREGQGEVRIEVVNLSDLSIKSLTAGAPDYAPGHSDNGSGTILGYDNFKNQYVLTSLANPSQKTVVLDLKDDWTQASHISLSKNGAWVLISFYSTDPNPKSAYAGEIILVPTDGSGKVKHLAKHRSVYREYWDTPRASLSRDGKFAIYTSNFGSSGRRDVYVLRTP